jgi:hypothetical protein
MTPTHDQFPDGDPGTERIIVLQLLRRDRSEWWRRTEVLRKLRDIDPDAVLGSLEHLARLGLLDRAGARFKASDALRYIDNTLDLICL